MPCLKTETKKYDATSASKNTFLSVGAAARLSPTTLPDDAQDLAASKEEESLICGRAEPQALQALRLPAFCSVQRGQPHRGDTPAALAAPSAGFKYIAWSSFLESWLCSGLETPHLPPLSCLPPPPPTSPEGRARTPQSTDPAGPTLTLKQAWHRQMRLTKEDR